MPSTISGQTNAASTSSPRHLPGLQGAITVSTPGWRKVGVAIKSLKDSGICVVEGQPGVGKTFAVSGQLASLSLPVFWADMPHSPKGKEATSRIYQAVTGETPPKNMTEYALTEETVGILEGLDAVLVIDEAQNLTISAVRQFRYFHDRPESKLKFVLVGCNVRGTIGQVAEIVSRVARWVQIDPLSATELGVVLPKFHPLFVNTTPAVLAILQQHAGGNLRAWARIAESATAYGATTCIDPDTASIVLSMIRPHSARGRS
jgi:DNA transposition AAA+ family ATPase